MAARFVGRDREDLEETMTKPTNAERQLRLLTVPIAGLMPLPVGDANDLLTEWGHYLGPVKRPFRQEAYALEVDQRPVSIAVSASIVSVRVKGFSRTEVVELVRLCTDPGHRWATRVMLRLWREILAPRWSCWPVRAAVAYSQTRSRGHLPVRRMEVDGRVGRINGRGNVEPSAVRDGRGSRAQAIVRVGVLICPSGSYKVTAARSSPSCRQRACIVW